MCDLRFAHTTVSDGQRAFACASVANWLAPTGALCGGEAGPAVGEGVGLIRGAVAVGVGPGAVDVGGVESRCTSRRRRRRSGGRLYRSIGRTTLLHVGLFCDAARLIGSFVGAPLLLARLDRLLSCNSLS